MIPKFVTDHPVAFDSPDHIHPTGTIRDNSRNKRYNQKLITFFENALGDKTIRILDLGCSGGGFVGDMHDLGWFAVGVEGSDLSKKTNRGEWGRLKDIRLFTADITKKFSVLDNISNEIKFDLITSWEVLEHLNKDGLDGLFKNIENLSHSNTLLMFSVAIDDCYMNGVNLHQTVENKDWWIKYFKSQGWEESVEASKFFNRQYIRSSKFGDHSFELVLSKIGAPKRPVPKLTLRAKLIDAYSGSFLHTIVKLLVWGGMTR